MKQIRLELYPIDPLVKELERAGNLDEIAPKMLNAAAPYLVDTIKKALAAHRRTGSLINSVKAGKAKKMKNGGYRIATRFEGYDPESYKTDSFPRGTPNAVKAMGLEYGSSNEPARPFLQRALNDAEDDVIEIMQITFNAEMGKGL